MILEQTAARQTKLLSLLRREFGLSAGRPPIPMRRSRPATGCAS